MTAFKRFGKVISSTKGKLPDGKENMAKTLTPKELAVQLETDPRTLRKFLRSVTPKDDQPGKGNRWEIEGRKVASLRKQFAAWNEARTVAAEDEETEGVETPDES